MDIERLERLQVEYEAGLRKAEAEAYRFQGAIAAVKKMIEEARRQAAEAEEKGE